MLDRFNTPWSRNISILFTTTNIQNSDQKFALFSFRKYLQKNDTKKTFSFLGKFSFTHFSFEEKMWTVYNRHLTSEYNLQRNIFVIIIIVILSAGRSSPPMALHTVHTLPVLAVHLRESANIRKISDFSWTIFWSNKNIFVP